MSDKSLPKPVLPRDPRADVNHAGVDRVGVGHTNIGPDQSQMPPSARVQAPIKSPTLGLAKPVQPVKPAQPVKLVQPAKSVQPVKPAQPAQLAQKPLTAGPPPATGPSLTVGPPPGADIIPPSLPGGFPGKSPQSPQPPRLPQSPQSPQSHPLQPPQPPQPPPGVIPQPPPGAIPQPPPGTTLQPPTQAQGERKQNSFLAESPNVGHETNEKMKPAFANVKASPFKYLPYLIGGLVLIGIVGFVINKVLGNKTNSIAPAAPEQQPAAKKSVPAEQTSLTYWGLWEPDNTVTAVLEKFEAINPGVKVNYVMQSHKDYRERLQTAVSSGNGPDVFRYHASWAPMFKEELSPMPQSIMTAAEYQQTFYQVAAKQLNVNGQIVGVPLMYEGLGLYYNKEMLTAANSEPPSTWAELKTLATKLTVRSGDEVKRGGMAIGNASNVEHFADILGLLMLQNGADPKDPTSKEAQDALAFYTNFFKEDKVWSDKLPSSTVAFARGDVAMMLAPSWRAHEVKTINPELDFGIVSVPRLGDDRLAWASFWAEGVSSKSKNKDKAWALLKFLSSKEIQQELYSNQSQVRSFGEIYSRTDLADALAGNELVAPFLQDAPYATGWYLSSYTHDNGINDLLIKYYEDAINAILGGKPVLEALETVGQGTGQILRQYGVE